jgi:hypothetical protein
MKETTQKEIENNNLNLLKSDSLSIKEYAAQTETPHLSYSSVRHFILKFKPTLVHKQIIASRGVHFYIIDKESMDAFRNKNHIKGLSNKRLFKGREANNKKNVNTPENIVEKEPQLPFEQIVKPAVNVFETGLEQHLKMSANEILSVRKIDIVLFLINMGISIPKITKLSSAVNNREVSFSSWGVKYNLLIKQKADGCFYWEKNNIINPVLNKDKGDLFSLVSILRSSDFQKVSRFIRSYQSHIYLSKNSETISLFFEIYKITKKLAYSLQIFKQNGVILSFSNNDSDSIINHIASKLQIPRDEIISSLDIYQA